MIKDETYDPFLPTFCFPLVSTFWLSITDVQKMSSSWLTCQQNLIQLITPFSMKTFLIFLPEHHTHLVFLLPHWSLLSLVSLLIPGLLVLMSKNLVHRPLLFSNHTHFFSDLIQQQDFKYPSYANNALIGITRLALPPKL